MSVQNLGLNKAKKLDIKDIRLCGNPEKDKVDNK